MIVFGKNTANTHQNCLSITAKMKIKAIKYNCCSNGPFTRTAVFIAGCPGVIWNKKTKKYDHCPSCFNSEAWTDTGEDLTDELLSKIIKSLEPDYIDGISILGGEPMCKENQLVTWKLVNEVRKVYGNKKTVWLWSGYIMTKNLFNKSRIPYTKYRRKILKNVDVLVDGPFIKDRFDINLKYRGSSNQRVIKLK